LGENRGVKETIMATLIHANGKRPNHTYRVYGEWGERRFPAIRSKSEFYTYLARELGLLPGTSRKDIVFALMDKSWDGTKWVDDLRVRFKSARERRGLTQAQLADRAGLSLEGIRALEQGLRRPGADTLRRIAVALQTSVDQLAGVPTIQPGTETHEVIFS
jgi:DNA-binding XRE family transcriptional regulator